MAGVDQGRGDSGYWRWCAQARQWISQGSAVVAGADKRSDGESGCEQGQRWLWLRALVTAVAQGGGSTGCESGLERKEAGREDDMNSKRLPLLLLL